MDYDCASDTVKEELNRFTALLKRFIIKYRMMQIKAEFVATNAVLDAVEAPKYIDDFMQDHGIYIFDVSDIDAKEILQKYARSLFNTATKQAVQVATAKANQAPPIEEAATWIVNSTDGPEAFARQMNTMVQQIQIERGLGVHERLAARKHRVDELRDTNVTVSRFKDLAAKQDKYGQRL